MLNKKEIKRLLSFLEVYKKEIVITLFSTIVISLIGVLESFLLNYLIDNVLYANAKTTLLTISIIMLFVSVFQIGIKGVKNILVKQISYKMEIDLMKKFYAKILNSYSLFLEKHKSGELLSRLNDTRIVRQALSDGLISIIANFIMFAVIGGALYCINKTLFIILLISVLLLSSVVLLFGRFFAKEYPVSMEKYAELQSFINESFSGVESIKSYPSFFSFKNQFNDLQEKYIKNGWHIEEKCILQNSYCSAIEKMSTVLIIIIGALFVMKERMTLGQVIGFISLSGFFTTSVSVLLDLQAGIQEAFAAIKRLFEILDETSEDDYYGIRLSDEVPEIIFKQVCFSYSTERQLYKNFDLIIQPGEWVCLVGKTGCGKTTIAKLILKLCKPQEGLILWNGLNLQKVDTESLRKKIAYIPQEHFLFSGTIIENITMFDDSIPEEKIIAVTKKVGIYQKIMNLEKGFQTIVGERGILLSGGEKQKIVICRALIKDPLIVIFDEATSNLDTESEKNIVNIIQQLKIEKKTVISIAHRLSTVKKCDKIYVLVDGNIQESGTYLELKNEKGIFSKLINI